MSQFIGTHDFWSTVLEDDCLAIEEPLEIRIGGTSIAVTMRTPGNDHELAIGFLFTEGLIGQASDVNHIRSCGENDNVVKVLLKPEVSVNLAALKRNFYMTSSCGVCGKASIEGIKTRAPIWPRELQTVVWNPEELSTLSEKVRLAQKAFRSTGGMHAAALFDLNYRLLMLYEDVGRHNALDKLIGWALKNRHMPVDDAILWLSGRGSFELIQKAYMAGIKMVATVGAPSSLAVQLANESQITLVGFLRGDSMNVY